MAIIIIPMAGASSRFYNAGYTVPKYMLPLGNETVFDKSVKSFEKMFWYDKFIFIVRKDDEGAFDFVNDHARALGILNFRVVEIDKITKGQAETVMEGLYSLDQDELNEPIYIFNIDTIRKRLFVFYNNYDALFDAFDDPDADENKWSFCLVDRAGYIRDTAEKQKISCHCSTGLYIFKSALFYMWLYLRAVKMDKNYNYYIAPLFNFIQDKTKTWMLPCDKEDVEFSGVPEEYESLKIKYKDEEKID